MEEQNQNFEQDPQIQQDYKPVPQEEAISTKSNWRLIIGSLALFLILIAGAIFWYLSSRPITRETNIDNNINIEESKESENIASDNKILIESAGKQYIITYEDVDILEHYSGVTWAENEAKVYFLKYIEIDLSQEMKDSIEEDYFTMFEKKFEDFTGLTKEEMENMTAEEAEKHRNNIPEEAWLEMFNSLPEKYDDKGELFQEVQVFEYDIGEDKINFLASMDYDPNGYPVNFFFSAYTQNNKFNFGDFKMIYTLDFDSNKITSRAGPAPSGSNNRVSIGGMFGSDRYISLDQHGYFELPCPIGFDDGSDAELKYFYDSSIRLKASNQYNTPSDPRIFAGLVEPQGILDIELLRSPEEIAFRNKI